LLTNVYKGLESLTRASFKRLIWLNASDIPALKFFSEPPELLLFHELHLFNKSPERPLINFNLYSPAGLANWQISAH
jgi:hypothetical protein